MNIKNIFMFIIRMDISGNLDSVMFQYTDNMRQYNDNMRQYNDNMRKYLDIIANRERVYGQNNRRNEFTYFYNPPVRPVNSIFSSLFPTTRRANSLQDVIVRPTREQILEATEIISFDENATNNNTNCPITLEPFINGEPVCQIKHCSHLFRETALNDWFRRNVRCPVCRYDIRDYVNEESEHEIVHEENEENEDNEYSEIVENEYSEIVENEYSEIVEELLNETMQQNENQRPSNQRPSNQRPSNQRPSNQRPSSENSFTRNLTNAIRGFVNSELANLPNDLNNVASELLYTFDIPLSIDVSGNIRI